MRSIVDPPTSARKKKRGSNLRVDNSGATTELLTSALPPDLEEDVITPSSRQFKRSSTFKDEEDGPFGDSYDFESNRYQETYIDDGEEDALKPGTSSSYWRLCRLGFCCVLLAGVTLFLLYFFKVLETDAFEDNLVKQWIDSDPWANVSPNKNYVWPTSSNSSANGRIVDLIIWNAMGEPWQVALNTAVANWQDSNQTISTTNVLDLTMRSVKPDPECEPVPGVIKICSANYGPTGWRGRNQLELNTEWGDDRIIASAVKINEFYFEEESDDTDYYVRLYTVCHELGHAIGLPHWDENSFNTNNGNCMDYTETNFRENSRPDVTNFLFLEGLYA
jgi:predicted Zn-dependent protease